MNGERDSERFQIIQNNRRRWKMCKYTRGLADDKEKWGTAMRKPVLGYNFSDCLIVPVIHYTFSVF